MNLRKDHYRLLTLVCSIRLTPSGIDLPHGLFLLGVSACLPVLATFLLDGLISCQLSEPGWPAIAEVPYPFPSLVVGVVGCSQRFKELPPQPGFVISPLLGFAANLCFARFEKRPLDASLRIQNTTLYSGSFGSGVDEERS